MVAVCNNSLDLVVPNEEICSNTFKVKNIHHKEEWLLKSPIFEKHDDFKKS